MPKTDFVDAYSKSTGEPQRIPKSWLKRKDAPFTDFTLTRPANNPAQGVEPKAVKAASVKETK
ncbi:hypothetical protein [Glutamicibacter halophytocola]|uniref:hypothetical protein n=1 Tax=Glutamicibacter halophytocola TaxID=1933880 RepID=UPI0015C57AF4|nr:hypothetical protein [Glutamicibacter halophytocola]NQD40512.1 hypothetical protein [Glutamicibacter halophytocola]